MLTSLGGEVRGPSDEEFWWLSRGTKGFHVEVLPEAVGIRSSALAQYQSAYDHLRRRLLLDLLGQTGRHRRPTTNVVGSLGTVVDLPKDLMRLSSSVNQWYNEGEMVRVRRTRQSSASSAST